MVVVRNLLITMLLGGLWHGAAWHFVAWGGLWGTGLALHHVIRAHIALPRSRALLVAGWLFTQVFVLVAWVLFRADSFDAAGVMLRAMAGEGGPGAILSAKDVLFIGGTAVALLLATGLARSGRTLRAPVPQGWSSPVLYGTATAVVLLVASVVAPTGREAFIYFQF
jgi:hypothetical protein